MASQKSFLENPNVPTIILGVGAIYLLYKSDFFGKIATGIGDIGSGLGGGAKSLLGGTGAGLYEIGSGIGDIGTGLGGGLYNIGGGAGSLLSGVGGGVYEIGAGAGYAVGGLNPSDILKVLTGQQTNGFMPSANPPAIVGGNYPTISEPDANFVANVAKDTSKTLFTPKSTGGSIVLPSAPMSLPSGGSSRAPTSPKSVVASVAKSVALTPVVNTQTSVSRLVNVGSTIVSGAKSLISSLTKKLKHN